MEKLHPSTPRLHHSRNRDPGRSPPAVDTAPDTGPEFVVVGIESLRDVRDHLSDVLDRVEHHHERVVITRDGRPAAVIIHPDDLAQLEETIDVLSDPAALADIAEADAAYAQGDVIGGIDAARRLRP